MTKPVSEGAIYSFGEYELDTRLHELRHAKERLHIEPQVFDVLAHLFACRDRVVTKEELLDGVWGHRYVAPTTLNSRIKHARQAVGDDGAAQRVIRTIHGLGFRVVAEVEERTGGPGTTAHPLEQRIQFCTASDGVRIAYATSGSGPALVKPANWLTHLEYDWESPVWSHLLRELAAGHRLIRYDARGNGLSDWEVDDISFEAFARDLESVVEATGIDRFALLGISQGCAVSIAYAVRYPQRVSHLVLYGGFARGRRKRGSPQEIEQADALLTLMRQGWGQENPAFRQIFTSLFMPGATAEQGHWFNQLQQKTTSPENAARIRRAVDEIDVTDLLPRVTVPTLVLHCRSDAVQPFEEGRTLAAGIRGARFVALEGHNHMILEGDPGWPRFRDEVKAFLRS